MYKYIVPILITVSNLSTIMAVIPYFIQVIKRKAKPRIVTWAIWGTLTGIAGIAAIAERQYSTAIFLLVSAFSTMSIAVIGWKRGDKEIGRLDIGCFVGAVIGIALWRVFDSPALAVIAVISADFIGGIPTIVHSWKLPSEENWLTFMFFFIGSICTLLVLSDWRITSFAYPMFITFNSSSLMIIIITRRKYLKQRHARSSVSIS